MEEDVTLLIKNQTFMLGVHRDRKRKRYLADIKMQSTFTKTKTL